MELERLNKGLRSILQKSRVKMGLSCESVADSLALEYNEILLIEENPIRVPLYRLSRAIKFYDIWEDVSLLLLDASLDKPNNLSPLPNS